ncbi:hypothetical protein KPL78_18800 [Roseomonas sp. HJA6]|uniref:DUF4345 domain-containing protein n=1 Tax=Roseomonas alba TaxID=2846776 RepID=A0ABS7AC92_9PROT|nr:hypothetical protein [Neoroseomonas alba]MBW6399916.1 hypothetical protein [Neoroseomonas alba]
MHSTLSVVTAIVLPAAFTLAAALNGAPLDEALAGWFAFWAVGARLAATGLNDLLRPRYTTETIFRVTDRKARGLTREIGFRNLALGTIGLGSLAFPGWVTPAAIGGAVLYALAAAAHAMARQRTPARMIAMGAELAVAGVLVVGAVWMQMEA